MSWQRTTEEEKKEGRKKRKRQDEGESEREADSKFDTGKVEGEKEDKSGKRE